MEKVSDGLKTHVYALADQIGERNVMLPAALHAAEQYIAQQWEGQGYSVNRLPYTVEGIDCANLEATRYGSRFPDDMILVGAHYDTVFGSPGADDNASGVAALIELARLFSKSDCARTIRFVSFVNEEPPFFAGRHMGSLIYAKTAKQRGDQIRFMVSLEMLGCYYDTPNSQRYPALLKYIYPDRANFIAFVSNRDSRSSLQRLVDAFRRHSEFPLEHLAAPLFLPGVALSDHFSFWRQGYSAIMVTDTAFYRNPWYHTAGDLPEKLHYGHFAEVVQGLYLALQDCASRV
ncbi:M28 family peptidase [Methylocaldum sp.]|uniref:M28 family peptidase n=1 Tax=Methylocaldum sp. TaxID=1969727 RepID=UPI002D26718D|nr:M28 family peptidase [Methylocaldum sp.]HYE37163.1 M28 family peptidase [Methylocaldum sp.]